MADRLSKITTRGGDKGETSLGDGTRVPKDDERIALIGDVDELNSWIGVVASAFTDENLQTICLRVQHDLFDLGGGLSMPGSPVLSEAHVRRLDEQSAALNKNLAPLKEFILPGGAQEIAICHVARTVCRRAERAMASFYNDAPEAAHALAYLNRLSDFLFIAARIEAKARGVAEVYWRRDFSAGAD